MKTKEFWTRRLAEQKVWIESCGGDLQGYLNNPLYCRRTVENITAIYNADMDELKRVEERVGKFPPESNKVFVIVANDGNSCIIDSVFRLLDLKLAQKRCDKLNEERNYSAGGRLHYYIYESELRAVNIESDVAVF